MLPSNSVLKYVLFYEKMGGLWNGMMMSKGGCSVCMREVELCVVEL